MIKQFGQSLKCFIGYILSIIKKSTFYLISNSLVLWRVEDNLQFTVKFLLLV